MAHITTQMKAIKQGAPADMIFQSIAGTEIANRSFGISADLIREAEELIKNKEQVLAQIYSTLKQVKAQNYRQRHIWALTK